MAILRARNLFDLDGFEIFEFLPNDLEVTIHSFFLYLVYPVDMVDHQLGVTLYGQGFVLIFVVRSPEVKRQGLTE